MPPGRTWSSAWQRNSYGCGSQLVVGRVIDRVKSKEEKAGNDLYLTIDATLQKAAYNIIEQELAGILLAKIQTRWTLTGHRWKTVVT